MEGDPPPEEDFSQIPLVERSTHKNWKARLSAYNDVIASAAKTASDTDPFFTPFLSDPSLLKKWCLDANAIAQEKGVEAVLAIVTNSGETSAKLRPEIVPSLVDKALGNTRASTKRKGADLCAMFVEVENGGEGVVTDVLAGVSAKTPKAVAGAVACLKELVESFGVPALGNIKPLLKALPKIFGHSDKNVRAEGTGLTLALYTYLGPALMPALADLKPVQVTELQNQFTALDGEGKGAGSGKPQRYTRKAQREREAGDGGDEGDGAAGGAEEEAAAIDPLSLLDPVDVLALFPSDVMERLGSAKWKERLEACEECNKVLDDPKNARISDSNIGAYSSLVGLLGTKCQKDANVNVVTEAAKLLEGLARGVGRPFGQFKSATVPPLMERLKERKASVVEALGKALDAIFLTTTLADVTEDILTALKSKNPQVKEGSLNFLHRSLRVTQQPPASDHVKPMAEALVGLLSDSAEPVRTAAAECLGTMMKILGERAFNPYVESVPEIQLAKVKDAFARAEIKYRAGGKPAGKPGAKPAGSAAASRPAPVKKAAPPPPSPPAKASKAFGDDELLQDIAPPVRKPPARLLARQQAAKAAAAESAPSSSRSASPVRSASPAAAPPPRSAPTPRARPVAKPAAPAPALTAGPSKPAPSRGGGGPAMTLAGSPTDPVKYRFTPEDAAAQAAEVIPADYHTKLADAAWKVRLEGADEMVAWVGENGGAEQVDSEIMMRFLGKTPGWGEKNFQVSAKVYQVMALMGEKSPTFGKPAAALIIAHLTDKLGDMKLKKPAGDALVVCAEKTSLAFVLAQSYDSMSKQKAPKALADALTWIKQQVIDFGIAGITLRELITFIKTALGSPNAMVRSSATALLVQVKIAVGADISGFIEDLNPQLLTTINKEFDKVADQSAPEPTRQQADLCAGPAAGAGGKGKGGADPLDDLIPRVDLDKLVNQTTVLNDSKSDAWKVRKEAFEALSGLLEIKSNQRLKPTMGEICTVLKKAMADTNLSVKMLALGIISKVASGMGQPFEKYCRQLVPAVASVCADQKAGTRTAALNTLTAMSDAVGGLDPMYGSLAASLESTNPALRASVLGWLAAQLQAEPPSSSADLGPLAAPLISCLEDRNGDVRKGAGAVLPFVVTSAGYDHVMEQTTNLKPASRSTIVPLIEKARASAPASSGDSDASSRPPNRAGPPLAATRTTAPPARSAPTPSRPTSTIGAPKPALAAPGRSIAMKALSAAPSSRPVSGLREGPAGGFGFKSRMAPPRSASASTAASLPSAADDSAGRTIPFVTSAMDARSHRLKRDTARWNLDPAARNDMLEYLLPQMEPHASSDIFTLLFSKDHRAEEDFMAALAVIAEFYDPETSPTFELHEEELQAIQLANVDLALKYAALRLLYNNTQLSSRCLEVISNVMSMLERSGERLSDAEVKLFVPALIIKLGDAKFGPRLAAIFDGMDKLIPASQVVQLLVQYGLEDKTAGKTGKNESLQLIEKAYRKRGSVLRKDDRTFYEAVAKCIADQGTRQNALTLMALLQIQGESRNLQAVIEAMPTSAKDMLANRRATMAASKTSGQLSRAVSGESGPSSPRSGSPLPRPKVAGAATPNPSRLSRDMGSGSNSPRGIPAPSASRLPTGAPTPGRSIPSASGLPRPGAGPKRNSQPTEMNAYNAASNRPSMQPLGRPGQAAVMSEAAETVAAMKTRDVEDGAEALKAAAGLLEEDDQSFVAEARQLLEGLCFQLELLSPRPEDLLEPRNLRRVKHLMRTIHLAFSRANVVKRLKLEGLERLYAGIRKHYAMLEVWTEAGGEDNQPASDLRDYMSMVLSSLIATPARELVYTMLFDALVDLCKDPGQNPNDPHTASEIGVVLQCTYKRVRSIDNDLRSNRIQAGALLSIIEELLQVIPPVQWRRRPKYGLPHGDLPLRVIKTLLQRVIVYTKEINVGIYDLLQEQFGADADTTTVYSYIFRISSADDAAATTAPATQAAAAPQQPAEQPNMTRQRSNGHDRPQSVASASTRRSSTGQEASQSTPSKSPTRDLSDAERLVRRLTDPRDSEQRLNELYAFMKSSPDNEAEARAAISSILTSAAQTFVWRAIDRRTGDDEPKSPPPPSPIRSPIRDMQSPPLPGLARSGSGSGSGSNSRRPSMGPRPSSMIDRTQPVDDQLAQLKAVFGRATTRTSGSGGGSTPRGSPSARPVSEIALSPSSERPSLGSMQRPMSEVQRTRSASPELDLE